MGLAQKTITTTNIEGEINEDVNDGDDDDDDDDDNEDDGDDDNDDDDSYALLPMHAAMTLMRSPPRCQP
ncbi:hypothetical protein ElyMa_006795600 [Elysia marginata]|uniref:Uncharacterized protein n=1 Tax=Elysia marginata TaxID=1093978 RepID=A0AAV4J583_9GAST|nr:hypothetical protein ElyMa_006795600 [Elysia marginata]